MGFRLWSVSAVALALAVVPSASVPAQSDPTLEAPGEALDAALECPDTFDDGDHEPLLLVHATFTNGWENWGWNYQPALTERGWDVCIVTMPERTMGDIQTSTEYVVHALRQIHARSGELVDMLGHSQGGLEARWAVKWWDSARAVVDDMVMLGTPNHGTGGSSNPLGRCFPSCHQMMEGSQFLTALNGGDETPGDISYTSIYTLGDEFMQPAAAEAVAALDGAANVLIQDVCPGRPVDHVSLAADAAVHDVVMDALTHSGPADTGRIDPVESCTGTTFEGVDMVSHGAEIMQRSFEQGFPETEFTEEEPPLRPYASGDAGTTGAPGTPDSGDDGQDGGPGEQAAPSPPGAATVRGAAGADEAARAGEPLPATGGGLMAGLVGLALMAPLAITRSRCRTQPGCAQPLRRSPG